VPVVVTTARQPTHAHAHAYLFETISLAVLSACACSRTLTQILCLQPETTATRSRSRSRYFYFNNHNTFGSIHRLCHSNYVLSTPTLIRSSDLSVKALVILHPESGSVQSFFGWTHAHAKFVPPTRNHCHIWQHSQTMSLIKLAYCHSILVVAPLL
jgi:hypothetical protein